jgi:hypothetical protein
MEARHSGGSRNLSAAIDCTQANELTLGSAEVEISRQTQHFPLDHHLAECFNRPPINRSEHGGQQ